MTPLIEKAKMVADILHCKQRYGEGKANDYMYHLEKVYAVLIRFGYTDENLLSAAYLHDSVEDTQMTIKKIEQYFGKTIAHLVYGVTNEQGRNRKERNEKTYPKIRGDAQVTALKLADRIANIEHSIANKSNNFIKMYWEEYSHFRGALYEKGVNDVLWNYLDGLFKEQGLTISEFIEQ